jgi:hypothetical protein
LSPLTDRQALEEISKYWRVPESDFDVIARYDIKNSLPLFTPLGTSDTTTAKITDDVYLAGDYLTAGSQNGALLSGRRAAMELLLDQG